MKYVSKPLVVDAMQFQENNLKEVQRWLNQDPEVINYQIGHNGLVVSGYRDMVQVEPGEYLIRRDNHVEILDAEDFEERFSRPVLHLMKARQHGKSKTLSEWFADRSNKGRITIKSEDRWWKRDQT